MLHQLHRMKLRLLNALLHGLHLAVILFSCIGWIWPATRPWHLGLCGLVLTSWFLIGPIVDEPGYCVLTGIQHKLWRKLGREDHPGYMVYLYEKLLRRPAPARTIARVTQLVLYSATLISVALLA
ncbi:MAG: hypothetical protein ACI8QC_000448 [Planctomycetota bacterium]